MDGVRDCVALTRLDLGGCESLQHVDGLTGCSALEELTIGDGPSGRACSVLASVRGLRNLTRVKKLSLKDCIRLATLEGVEGMTALTELDCGACTSLTDVSALAGLEALTVLTFQGCTSLTDVSAVAGLLRLTSLDLHGTRVADAAPVAAAVGIQTLRLSCGALKDLAPLAAMTGVTELTLTFDGRVQPIDLTPVGRMSRLTALRLESLRISASNGKSTPIDLGGLAAAPSLTSFTLSGAAKGTDLGPLADLPGLTRIEVKDVDGLAKRYLGTFHGAEARTTLEMLAARSKRPRGEERLQLSALRTYLAAGRGREAIELARGLDDPEIWRLLTAGVGLNAQGRTGVAKDAEPARVREDAREAAALWVLR